VPIVSVSRGWTGENWKVSLYERLDRFNLRYMDAVVAVSDGQAAKVRKAGVPEAKLRVIRNAARLDAFKQPDPAYRARLRDLARVEETERVVVAAGRLSPEKGFDTLLDAAASLVDAPCRFVVFGEGAERDRLAEKIVSLGLRERFILAGFRDDLDHWLPWADVVALPSRTEGLPNVALEASAAGVAVVATRVGGTPEVIEEGTNGFLAPSDDPAALAEPIRRLCLDDELRRSLGESGRARMRERFSFAAQADAYVRLFEDLRHARCAKSSTSIRSSRLFAAKGL
jgi:glycosyltransferase involved in cell wall biosynthesis